jgi:hypothetical protein
MRAPRLPAATGVLLMAAQSAPVTSAGADRRGFRGTISIRYFLQAEPAFNAGGKSDGSGMFTGTYRVKGGRYRGKGAPKRS